MSQIPRDSSLDNSLALLTEGYTFISRKCGELQSDIFETRLMFQKVYCCYGEEAARIFYEGDRITRKRAIPPTTLLLLQGPGSVQTLDGRAHRWRKQMFLSIMNPESTRRLGEIFLNEWRAQISNWQKKRQIVLHEEVERILCRAACQWAGVPLPLSEVAERAAEFSAMIDGAGSVGPRNWKGMILRKRTEDWISGLITDIRQGRIQVPPESAASVIAFHRDESQRFLDLQVATVELINILRPTVAVARFITFAALALHEHPEYRERLGFKEDRDVDFFVQEVRRFYPFFPVVGGRVRNEFLWRGHHFKKGSWILLDLYGTNHDSRIWKDPYLFRPERYVDEKINSFNLIPQGAGDYKQGHRCPGEGPTNEIIRKAVRFLCTEIDYQVPKQNLKIDLSRMPAVPESRFIIQDVEALPSLHRVDQTMRKFESRSGNQNSQI